MFWILFLNIVGSSFEQYNDYCFKIWGTEELISIKSNSEIKVIPETLNIITRIYEMTKYGEKSHFSSMFISKSDKPYCTGGLFIPNFIKNETDYLLISVEVWYRYYKIDSFTLTLYPYNEQRYFQDYLGFNSKLKISFNFSISEDTFRPYLYDNITWSKKMVYANEEKVLCMRFMDIEGEYLFMTDYVGSKFKPFIIDQINILHIISHNDLEMMYGFYSEDHIVEIYECDKNGSYTSISFLVGDSVKVIEISLLQIKSEKVYKMKLIKENKEFVSATSLEYTSKLFDIRVKHELFEIALERRKRNILLYNQEEHHKFCSKEGLEISTFSIKYKENKYHVKSITWQHNENIKLSYYRMSSAYELSICPAT